MKKTIIYIIFLAIVLTLINFVINDLSTNSIPYVQNYHFQYKIGDSSFDAKGVPSIVNNDSTYKWYNYICPYNVVPNSTDKTVWIKVSLSNENLRDPSLYFKTFDQIFEVYLDNKKIYSFGDFNKILNHSPGSPWHIIELPENYSGKTLYIRMHALNKNEVGFINKFEINSGSILIKEIFKNDLSYLILIVLFIFIGLCSIIVYIFTKSNHNSKPLFWLALCSIFFGIWLFLQTDIKQFFIFNPILWSYTSITLLYFLPICFSIFINYLLNNKYALILNGIIIFTSVFIIAGLFMDALYIFPLVLTMPYFHAILMLEVFVVLYIVFKTFKANNSVEKIFAKCFAVFAIFIIIDVVRWRTFVGSNYHFLCPWGILFYVISMIFLLIHQLSLSQEKVILYSKEIQLKEEILNEKKKLLEEAIKYDKVKTEFFTNISHELRTPLNIIFSTVQLIELYIKKGDITTQSNSLPKHMKVMKQNCYRLLRLVNNIIDITKIDSGYMKASFQKLDIVSTVENITLSVADFIKSKGLNLIFDTDTEEKYMCFDCEKIERIILNLLSNAVKFSKPDSSIMVNLYDNDDSICIIVSDTGIGMSQDSIKSIFERFVQADQTLSRSHEGSGIGLSLVKALVEMHSGTISVESEVGKGSKFIINIPATIVPTSNEHHENSNINATYIEKINIEFSDIYY
ncbi:MAG: sensor histidine kinase [Bacillota bacterium]|nr:sensor histidine kinase [Bacillota bacterium]